MRQLVFLIFLLCGSFTAAQHTHAASLDQEWTRPAISFFKDSPKSTLTITQALAQPGWHELKEATPNFGYVSAPYWLRMPAPNVPLHQVLEINYSALDYISFYLLKDGEVIHSVHTGDRLPFSERPLKHPTFLLPFEVTPDGDYEILLKVQTGGAFQVPIKLWQRDALLSALAIEDQLHSIYYGVLITVIFFNLFIFFALRESTYLLYVLATFSYLFLLASLRGVTYPLLWPDNPWLHNQMLLIAVPAATLFSLLFARSFLKLSQKSPVLNKLIWAAIVLNLLAIGSTFILDYTLSIKVSVALVIPSTLLLTIIGPLQWLRGNPSAVYYTIAWGLLTLGAAVTAANKYGLIPSNFVTAYGLQIGSALEAILLTIALAARLYSERKDKFAAQVAEIEAMAARRKAELQMMEQALHDPFTDLPNRAYFEMAVNGELNSNKTQRYAIGVIHLSHLRAITKTLGHQNTDLLLKSSAQRFNNIMRSMPGILPIEQTQRHTFYLASLEPSTFGFLVDADAISQQPRSIVKTLELLRESIPYLGMQLPLHPQAGVAVSPDHSRDINTLIRRAYIAQESNEAKERGFAVYQPSHDSYSAARLTLASKFNKALQNGELALFLQPKLSLASDTIVGVEALLRWPGCDPAVPTDQIIAMAEETGLIKPLTRWVLEQAFKLRAEIRAAGHDVTVSVNISPYNLREPDFPRFVARLTTAHNAHAGSIIFEVTETSMMLDPANSLQALQTLDNSGIPLSIDDFGSGYSSLSYIKQLPAQEVKIDRSLIRDLVNEPEDRVIVQTTIDMCHSLGYMVVAEGVEDEATMILLRSMGCDMVQGYWLARPLSLDALLPWLDEYAASDQPINSLGSTPFAY